LQIDELAYHFLSLVEECNAAAASFSKISSHSFIRRCVGCIDGLLIRVTAPRETDTPDAKAFFSGHYLDYGINVQAICDRKCCFIYAAVALSGSSNDIAAYRYIGIGESAIKHLPLGKYVIGDNAYISSGGQLYDSIDSCK
jgi:DDE superfamily endonuclease